MRKNASRIDGNVRRIFGLLSFGAGLLLWAASSSPVGAFLVAVGLYLILTGSLRFAPEYVPFHARTHHGPVGPPER